MPTELTDNRPEEHTLPTAAQSGGFWHLLRAFLRKKEAPAKESESATVDPPVPTQESPAENSLTVDKQTALSLVLNRYSKLRKAGVIGRKKGEIGIFHEHTNEDSSVPAVETDSSTEAIAPVMPEQSIIPEWEYGDSVHIPASLLEEARELEQLTPQISAKDVEEAAKFLGVFSGHIDLSSFADYAVTDATDLTPEERAQIQAEGGTVAGTGGLFKELRDLIRRQKSVLQNLSGIATVFNPAVLARLMRGTQSVAAETKTEQTLAEPPAAPAVASSPAAATAVPTAPADVLSVPDAPAKPVALHTSDPTRLDERFLSQTPTAPAAAQAQTEITTDAPAKSKGSWWSKKETPAAEAAATSPARGAEIQAGESAKVESGNIVETVVVPAGKKDEGITLDSQDVNAAAPAEDFLENAAAPAETPPAPMTEGVAGVTAENAFGTATEEKVTLETVQQDREPTYWEKLSMQREAKAKAKEEEKRLKEQAKKEKEEEKQWAAEAKRREKLLEEKKKQLAGQKPEAAAGARTQIIIPKNIKKQGKFKAFMDSLNYMGMEKDRIGFIDNMGTMMDAGLPLIDALNALKTETRNKQMKKILAMIITAVEMGSPLWRAMDATYFFRQQQVSMVRVGEEAGNLVENLRYLSVQEEKDRSLRSKVKTAMIYPIIVLTMLMGIVLGLGMFVLPQLVGVLFSLGVPLPFVTRCIVMFTNFFEKHGSVFVPSLFASIIVMIILNKYTSFKVVVQWVVLHIPGIGVLVREATLSRFGVVMGGLMQAGVPVTEALESIAKVTALVGYKKFYYQLLEHVKLGDSFGTAFKKIRRTNKCFPPGFQQLIVTGEKSGSLTKIMFKIAEIHEKHASEVAEKLPVILEPMLLLFIGGLVGTIALGILAPIYSVVGKVGS